MATSLFLVLLLCIATLLLPFTDADVALDVQSLLAFKRRITHDPFEVLHTWHQNSPSACNWTGVSCSTKHPGRVIGLQLFNRSLGGVIAPEIEAEIARATHNFSPNYLLGQGNHGSVYVGALKGGDPVAIKVFSETQHRSGFLKECQTLGRVRHKNLMKIITICCTENLKAIVMPLMPKGNLHNLLHEKDAYGQLSTLSLQTRVKILQELAAGLSYLHHYCTPQIVHCDVKPENVLLDYDFSVKLSDFGIAKLLGNSNITETSTLRGSIGYIAPEFGAGEASVKGDIYSFGVVMLEVITRMKPTDVMFVDNLNLCNWVAAAFQGDANRMQLESVLNVNSGLEITKEEEWIIVEKILKIGVSACSHFVEERPAMDKIEGMLASLCDAKKEERVGPGNLDAILDSSLQPVQQVPESEYSSTFE